ncbi:FAD-dependent oxidoreductase [Streptomyces sp. NPDC056835]|uniref:FAD-dependent oxidoreductase n=1 Tax=Streptomyces sp. NPDC056835 TaxID=3345956 RepID=UPI0036ACE89B
MLSRHPGVGRRRTLGPTAGAAGSSAARDLSGAGRRVVVVEARNRVGGRMWGDRISMSVELDTVVRRVEHSPVGVVVRAERHGNPVGYRARAAGCGRARRRTDRQHHRFIPGIAVGEGGRVPASPSRRTN